jgi:type IV secretory pathway TraG/TraD family ATPase VirD4
MSRALGPRPPFAAGNAALAWALIAVFWGVVGVAWLAWGAAWLAAAMAGGRVLPFGTQWASAVVHGRTGQAWPGTPAPLVAVTGVLLGGALGAVVVIVWRTVARRTSQPGDPVAALSRDRSIRQLAQAETAKTAIRLRPSLAGSRPGSLPSSEIGLGLGRLQQPHAKGPALFATWEDTVLAFMGPRSGKTTSLGIPYVLSAPGPVVATSVKADLWAATAELRSTSGSGIWAFDPQHITAAGQRFWVNLLAWLTNVESAHRFAGHFVLTVDDNTKRDIWGPAAQELLTSLLLAAATSRRTLHHVSRWLDDPGSPTPAELLDDTGYRALASSLRGAQHGAPETRDGIYQTARTAAKCLHDEDIMAWVTPPQRTRLPAFDPARFAASRDALYLITESRSAASPLIAGLTDATMRAGRRAAEQAGGRLDPPMVLVLDEAANICRIADLPDLYSHLGSRGMIPVTILQSYEQGETVWGAPGMAALWGAATKKFIGAGVDSPRLTRDVAVLVGHHDVPVRSVSIGDGRASEQLSFQRRMILEAADIRAIKRGNALLLASGIRPALVGLQPWNARPDAALIDAARRRAEAAIQRAAETTGSPGAPAGALAAPTGPPGSDVTGSGL